VCGAQLPPIAGHVPVSSAPVPLPSGTARITFTTGSTGTPKGVCLSADHMFAVARAIVDTVGMQHAGRHLALLPPGILLETVGGFFAGLLAGGTWVCPPQAAIGLANPFQPDFAAMLAAMADQRITSLILVPEYLGGLVQAMETTGQRLPLLTLVAVGGARVPPELMIRARALGLPVRQGYGMTECASVVSLEDAGDDMPGNAGRPLPHMRARIAPDGEISLEGPLCLGTIGGKAPATPFATGDIGRIDEHGRLWIEGRKSSLIVTSYGRNIAPEWVEAALLAQPGIAQAMVYGDGEPAPMALLVPAQPDSDLAAAVARANATLPGYAHVRDWREAAHFTPANGRLTGNGRLRRKAIAEVYLDGPPAFFDELEADTVRQRLRFLAIPQLQAGLNGTITRQAYLDYLAQAYHHVRHTVPLMRAARARLADRPDLVAALDEYIEEEEGHEEWILNDITAAGGNGEHVRASDPAPATAAMVARAYDRIAQDNPVCFFGMVYVLESVSTALAQKGASAVAQNLGLPPQAFTYLTSHGALDQQHIRFFADLVNALDREDDRCAITAMAKDMFGLFGGVFASIDLMEEAYVAA
ncbi:MAG: AMP-binding protein, partial [Novosphingobium sp.]